MRAGSTPFTGWFGTRLAGRLRDCEVSEQHKKLESCLRVSQLSKRTCEPESTHLKERVMMRKSWPEISSAFAIGLGVGAILGMMWAPKSGEETRALLREKAQDGIDEAVAQGKKVARKA